MAVCLPPIYGHALPAGAWLDACSTAKWVARCAAYTNQLAYEISSNVAAVQDARFDAESEQ